MRCTKPVSNKWLLRPAIAMSEFAYTIYQNVSLLENKKFSFIKRGKLNDFFMKMKKYMNSLKRLNSKTAENATKEDVQNIFKMFYNEESVIADNMQEFFKAGGALFLTAIHFFVAQNVLCDPKSYANRMVADNPQTEAFKREIDVRSLLIMFENLCIKDRDKEEKRPHTSGFKKNLMSELSQVINQRSTSSAVQSTPNEKRRKRGHGKTIAIDIRSYILKFQFICGDEPSIGIRKDE